MTWAVLGSPLLEATTSALLLSMSAHLGEQKLQEWQNRAITQPPYHTNVSALTQLLKCVRECLWNNPFRLFFKRFLTHFYARGYPQWSISVLILTSSTDLLRHPRLCWDCSQPITDAAGEEACCTWRGLGLSLLTLISLVFLLLPDVVFWSFSWRENSDFLLFGCWPISVRLHFHRIWRPFCCQLCFWGWAKRALVLETNMATEQLKRRVHNSNENSYFSSLFSNYSALNCLLHSYIYTWMYLLDYQFTWLLRKVLCCFLLTSAKPVTICTFLVYILLRNKIFITHLGKGTQTICLPFMGEAERFENMLRFPPRLRRWMGLLGSLFF